MTKRSDVMLSVRVTLHPNDEIANKRRCPIANSIKDSDPDILHVVVDKNYISYSRKSTDMRYTHWAPKKAKAFINKIDALARKAPDGIKRSDLPRPFDLELTTDTLKSQEPRRKGASGAKRATSVRSGNRVAMTQKLKVKKGPQPSSALGSRSRRPIPTISS